LGKEFRLFFDQGHPPERKIIKAFIPFLPFLPLKTINIDVLLHFMQKLKRLFEAQKRCLPFLVPMKISMDHAGVVQKKVLERTRNQSDAIQFLRVQRSIDSMLSFPTFFNVD
jgi:hypothetical protein